MWEGIRMAEIQTDRFVPTPSFRVERRHTSNAREPIAL